MSSLSDAYAGQKTPVSGQRATYWAMKAAEGGDPQGWLVLGIEYNTGKLGGNPPYWYQKAMESYRKAVDGGNRVAMIAIADLYAKGNGVPAYATQAQNWQAKAQSCQGGKIATIQQKVTQYKARAVAARDPALYPILAALPNIPNSPAQAPRNNSRSPAQARNADGSGFNQSITAGLVAAAVVVAAAAPLSPNSPTGNTDFDPQHFASETSRCAKAQPSFPGQFGC